MSWIRRIRRNTIKAVALGFAAAAVGSPSASAMARHDTGSASQAASEIPYLSHGVGITRETSLAEQHLANEARDSNRAGFGASRSVGGLQKQDGVTPTNLARAYVPKSEAVAASQPDGYQPQLRGSEPLIIRDAPDGYQPQTRATEVSVASSGSSIDWGNVAFGLGLGIGISALCALMLLERGRPRTVGA
jgi:hypothetical protein